MRIVCLALGLLALGAPPAWAVPTLFEPPPEALRAGLTVTPLPLRGPVALDTVRPVAPFVADEAPRALGGVHLEAGQVAVLSLDRLRVARVRSSTDAPLQFHQVVGDGNARAVVVANAEPLGDGTWLIIQGPEGDAVWTVGAEAAVDVAIDAFDDREGRLIRETARHALREKAAAPSGPVTLPETRGIHVWRAALALGEALSARAVPEPDAALRSALAAFRQALATAAWAHFSPFAPPVQRVVDRAAEAGAALGTPIDLALPDAVA
ncbi:MAG: hypothetical protein KC620_26010, partial [Myxococcales bacterium]|nr:hypothetical protein [Myxococcales bacterium]